MPRRKKSEATVLVTRRRRSVLEQIPEPSPAAQPNPDIPPPSASALVVAGRKAALELSEADAAAAAGVLGWHWGQLAQGLAYAALLARAVETEADDPRLKGENTLHIVLTNTNTGATQTVLVPGVKITY